MLNKVYPNPFSEHFTVVLNDWEDVVIQLSDKSGRIIFQKKAESNHEIFSSNVFSSGIYFLSAIKKETIETQKIVLN